MIYFPFNNTQPVNWTIVLLMATTLLFRNLHNSYYMNEEGK